MQWCCSLFTFFSNALLAVISIKIGYENAIRREATSDFDHVNEKSQRRRLAVVMAITRKLSLSAPMFCGGKCLACQVTYYCIKIFFCLERGIVHLPEEIQLQRSS